MPTPLNEKPVPPGDQINVELGDRAGSLTTVSLKIRTLEQALSASRVDPAIWRPASYKINSWEVTIGRKNNDNLKPATYTNYQVSVKLERIVPTLAEQAIRQLLKGVKGRPARLIVPDHRRGRYLLEISLPDAHFALLAWRKETGDNYDLKHAEESFALIVEDLLGKTEGCRPEKILFPIGNDFFHINNPEGVTPRGHNVLDVDGRLAKVFETGAKAMVHALERCARVAPVQAIWIPGNHDPQTSFFLCQYLQAYFRLNPNVEIDVGPSPRKYLHYGCNLIGYTHGNEEKHADLPLLMANENRRIWGAIRHSEFHVGHYHKKKETRFLAVDTFGGVSVKVIPSISGTDAWHFAKGYAKGNRGGEAFLFDYYRGLVATYSSINLRNLKQTLKPLQNRPSATQPDVNQ